MTFKPAFPPVIVLLLLITAGCTVFPDAEPSRLLDPQPEMPTASGNEPQSWTLNVARPETDPMRDSTRVLVRTENGQLQVHPSANWIAATPDLLRLLLVRHVRDTDRLAQVSSGAAGLDRTLALDLRQFELAEVPGSLQARIELEARLYDSSSGKLLGRRLFQQREQVDSIEPARVNTGFETALAALIPELADWLIAQ
ncbi:MAG: ABC-type transport auxiliary lipoprotein family protein [Thiogranum sp.]|nr:ABC-type transport auxiliary lipoprotein family protein [Thiogranum sp.]